MSDISGVDLADVMIFCDWSSIVTAVMLMNNGNIIIIITKINK